MGDTKYANAETEAYRQEHLAVYFQKTHETQELLAQGKYFAKIDEAALERTNAPGSFNCHQAMCDTFRLEKEINKLLVDHPSILTNPEWFALASQASGALFELSQQIAEPHLEVIGRKE